MILIIDNYDSFTHNLVHYFQELGCEVVVRRNDAISVEQIRVLAPASIVLSPGPCTPNESGVCLEILAQLSSNVPILGVCLGHQAIAQVFGGKIIRAKQVVHGKTSLIYHNNTDLFTGLPNPHRATRYHSLVIDQNSLPDCFDVTAWTQTQDGKFDEIMGIKHKTLPVSGIQFHPESILSEHGHNLLKNFLKSDKQSLS